MRVFHPHCGYLCQHSLFGTLHSASRPCFTAIQMLSYRSCVSLRRQSEDCLKKLPERRVGFASTDTSDFRNRRDCFPGVRILFLPLSCTPPDRLTLPSLEKNRLAGNRHVQRCGVWCLFGTSRPTNQRRNDSQPIFISSMKHTSPQFRYDI